jgi:hypothetical protein
VKLNDRGSTEDLKHLSQINYKRSSVSPLSAFGHVT